MLNADDRPSVPGNLEKWGFFSRVCGQVPDIQAHDTLTGAVDSAADVV